VNKACKESDDADVERIRINMIHQVCLCISFLKIAQAINQSTMTTATYNPLTHNYTYNEQYTLPVGAAPLPLPTSSNYVRPVKQHKGIGQSVKDVWNRMANKAQRSTYYAPLNQ
jgi:hypothetical protein